MQEHSMKDWDKGYTYARNTGIRSTITKKENTTRFRLGYQAGVEANKRDRLKRLLLNEPNE